MANKKTSVIVAAAGKGTRMNFHTKNFPARQDLAGGGVGMNHSLPKQYLPLEGKPILAHTLINLSKISSVDSITLVVSEDRIDWCREKIIEKFNVKKIDKIIAGGETRGKSVRNGLESLDKQTEIVAIHDGVRPFITAPLFNNIIKRTEEYGAVVCAIPLRDTLKNVNEKNEVKSTQDRKGLWLVQTPQIFKYSLIMQAYKKALEEGFQATDDAGVVERLPHSVKIVEGSSFNVKITTPEDLILAEAIFEIGNW